MVLHCVLFHRVNRFNRYVEMIVGGNQPCATDMADTSIAQRGLGRKVLEYFFELDLRLPLWKEGTMLYSSKSCDIRPHAAILVRTSRSPEKFFQPLKLRCLSPGNALLSGWIQFQ